MTNNEDHLPRLFPDGAIEAMHNLCRVVIPLSDGTKQEGNGMTPYRAVLNAYDRAIENGNQVAAKDMAWFIENNPQ